MQSVILNTSGDGFWSDVSKAVTITNIKVGFVGEDLDFGELCVYFDTRTWDTNEDGLIYTDKLFLKELRRFLNTHNLNGNDVEYSEQGMQGDDYVSLDIGKKFLNSWARKFNTTPAAMYAAQEKDFAVRWQ